MSAFFLVANPLFRLFFSLLLSQDTSSEHYRRGIRRRRHFSHVCRMCRHHIFFYCFSVEAFNIIFIVSSGLRIFAQHSRNVAPSESYFCTCVCDEMCFCRIQYGELSYVWNATWLLRAIVNTGFLIRAVWHGIYMRNLHIWGSWISQLP